MSRYRVRVQLIEWYEIAVDGASLKQAVAEAEELPPPAIRGCGKHLSTETGLADSASVVAIAKPLPPGALAGPAKTPAPRIYGESGLPSEVLLPEVPSSHMARLKPGTLVNQPSKFWQRTLTGSGVHEMPAQELAAALPPPGPFATHNWAQPEGRRLELQPGKTLVHWRCTTCRRSFVHDLAAKEWYAAFPRVLDFERLDEVSQRWLAEKCSGHYQAADEQARKTPGRIVKTR